MKELFHATAGGKVESYPPRLGVGLPYQISLPADLFRPGVVDFVEITPEFLCTQRPAGSSVAIELVPDKMERAQETCDGLPMVVHGVELSIGSAHGWNRAYIEMLDRFQARWSFVWHSEHLGYQTMAGEHGESLRIGVPLPLPPTQEAVLLVAERAREIGKRYGVPFLLENPAHYLEGLPVDPEIGDDGGLMRAITEKGDCFQLLDLHNVYCNSVNHHLDAFAIVDGMALDRVVEIHVAGGSEREGVWMDAHDGRVPEPVWELLEYTLPRAPHAGGVIFEVLEQYAAGLGADVIAEEVTRAREIWRRCRPL